MVTQLDDLDRKILTELQEDAAQSLDEIARKVGSSKTPVWNRIRRMREQKVIVKQTALLDALFVPANTRPNGKENSCKCCVRAPKCWKRTGLQATSTIC